MFPFLARGYIGSPVLGDFRLYPSVGHFAGLNIRSINQRTLQ